MKQMFSMMGILGTTFTAFAGTYQMNTRAYQAGTSVRLSCENSAKEVKEKAAAKCDLLGGKLSSIEVELAFEDNFNCTAIALAKCETTF